VGSCGVDGGVAGGGAEGVPEAAVGMEEAGGGRDGLVGVGNRPAGMAGRQAARARIKSRVQGAVRRFTLKSYHSRIFEAGVVVVNVAEDTYCFASLDIFLEVESEAVGLVNTTFPDPFTPLNLLYPQGWMVLVLFKQLKGFKSFNLNFRWQSQEGFSEAVRTAINHLASV